MSSQFVGLIINRHIFRLRDLSFPPRSGPGLASTRGGLGLRAHGAHRGRQMVRDGPTVQRKRLYKWCRMRKWFCFFVSGQGQVGWQAGHRGGNERARRGRVGSKDGPAWAQDWGAALRLPGEEG